jgi:alpha-L-fucosidase 2
MEEFDEPEPGHRHMSHLYGLCPGNEIAPRTTPALAAAAEKVLEKRLSQGGGGTGWSRAWVVNFWARLGRDEQALEHLTALLTRSTATNLFDMHPPFQIDGNFGGAAGIAEMLLQSHTGEIALLPALPQAWATRGSVRGLKARGNIEVGVTWESHRATQVTLRAVNGGSFRVRAPFLQRILNASTESGKIVEIIPDLNDDAVVTVNFPRNQTVLLKFA